MGSKKALAPEIGRVIADRHPHHTVVDAFAGTCAVAGQLAAANRVVVNDVHAFAATIGRALLSGSGALRSEKDVEREIKPEFLENRTLLLPAVSDRLNEESRLLEVTGGRKWRQYYRFVRNDAQRAVGERLPPLRALQGYRRHRCQPYALFTYLYANTYFGIRQCVEIDSLRSAIDGLPESRRDIYLLALIEAASHCAAAPGHFAQYLFPRDRANTQLIARYRRRSIWSRFSASLQTMVLPTCKARSRNRVFNKNAHAFAEQVLPKMANGDSPFVVYADPPYSRAQYSRYYHLLETLVLYDYPRVTGKGRYRDHRYETNFSRVGQVLPAMRSFVSSVAETGAPLFVSYPDNGLVFRAGGDMRDILLERYPCVDVVVSRILSHSTLGGAPGTGSIPVMEHVYHATFN